MSNAREFVMSMNPLNTMKSIPHRMVMVGALGIALTLSSCISPYAGPNERQGAVVGAVGGGLLGAIIGNQSGRPLEGAAIGGLLGSLAGTQIGASRDSRYYYSNYNRGYSVRRQPVYQRIYSPYRPTHYRYSRTPNYGYHSPYRSSYFVSNYRAPSYGYGRGWGYSPYCW